MKALTLNGYKDNANLKIQEVSNPKLKNHDEILIMVTHAGLNPIDYKIKNGDLKFILKLNFPSIMGNEFCGVVEEIGENVSKCKKGDVVYARCEKGKLGGFAEFVVEHQDNVALCPLGIDPSLLATVPLAGLTAWQALTDYANLQQNQKILIHGGGGAVGRFAIQFAKQKGAHVTTTISRWAEEIVKDLGADDTIFYREEAFEKRSTKYDCVFDLVGGETLDKSFQVCKEGGIVITVAGAPEPQTAVDLKLGLFSKLVFGILSYKQRSLAKKNQNDYRFIFMYPSGNQLEDFSAKISEGKLKLSLGKQFSINDYEKGFKCQESGQGRGKIVFTMDF